MGAVMHGKSSRSTRALYMMPRIFFMTSMHGEDTIQVTVHLPCRHWSALHVDPWAPVLLM